MSNQFHTAFGCFLAPEPCAHLTLIHLILQSRMCMMWRLMQVALFVVVQSDQTEQTCEGPQASSAVLLQASTNRTQLASEQQVASRIQHDLEDIQASLLERSHEGVHEVVEQELEDAVQGKNSRRRRSRRRTTTTTTTVDCGSSVEYVSIAWQVASGYCLEGSNSGGATYLDTSSCSSITNGRDKFSFVDQGDGYCKLQSEYATRRRSAKGKSVTCATNSKAVVFCAAQGSQSYTKFKLEDLGSNRFSMYWYDSSGNSAIAKRNPYGIRIQDYSSSDEPKFKVYKNAVYSSTCLLTKNDLGLTCWK